MTLEEFVQAEIDRTGKRVFTLKEVTELTEKWIEMKQAAAEPFTGWKPEAKEAA